MATTNTLLASAARTSTPSAVLPGVPSDSAVSWVFSLSVTVASGTGGLQFTLYFTDPLSLIQTMVAQATVPVTAIGTSTYEIKPGESSADSTQSFCSSLDPRNNAYTATVTHLDSSSYTYSLSVTQN